jgi:hypothetical protein
MPWQMSGLIVWVGLIGAANVSLPRYKHPKLSAPVFTDGSTVGDVQG